MQRLLRTSALILAVGGGALWFFGGMNTGSSQWTERDQNPFLTESTAASEPRFVIRPGIGFLAGTFALSGALALASRGFARSDRPRSDGPDPSDDSTTG